MSPARPETTTKAEPAALDRTLVATVLAVLMLAVVAVSSVSQLQQSADESVWVAHTREVLEQLVEAKSRAKALERVDAAPAIAADPPKVAALEASAQSLRRLTMDSPERQKQLDELDATIVRLRQAPTLADAAAMQSALDIMQIRERELLALRRRRASAANERARILVIAGNVVAFALVGYSVLQSRRELRGRQIAQAAAEEQRREAEEQRREAEEQRRAAEEQRRAAEDLYNRAPCGYHITRNPDLIYSRVNDTELAWLGRTREELIGKRRFFDFLTEESKRKIDAITPEERMTSENAALDLDVIRKDGTIFSVAIAASPARDADGKITGWMTTLFDTDAQKKAAQENERLRVELEARAATLETVNKDLESFSYSISHDLRAPLRAIGGFARILEEDHGEVLGTEGRRVLGVVRSNTSRMSQLVDDLLSFSRLGRKSVARVDVDMKRLVEDVVEEMRNQTGELSADVVIGDLPRAHADPGLVRQVFVNLVSNAVKYSSGKESAKVEVSATVDEGGPVYHVKDNGAGFDMQGYEKLFGVFQRLHRHEEFPGTGVGLAIAHRVVAKHGGRIWGEGKVGVGAEFHFTLPKESV